MTHATERDWIAATSGNAKPDRDEFERWALSQRGAPGRSDPRVWSYLIMMAEEMEALENGAYGQMHDELPEAVAYGVVRHFQQLEPNARRTRGSRLPAFRSMLRPNPDEYRITNARYAKDMMKVTAPAVDGLKGRAARLAHSIARGRYSNREGGYIMSKAAAERFERLYAEGWDASFLSGKLEPPPEALPSSGEGSTAADYEGYLGLVLDGMPIETAIQEYQLRDIVLSGRLSPWLTNAEKEALGGSRAAVPPSWAPFHARALEDFTDAARSLSPNRSPAPPPPPSALRAARERERARYAEDEEIPVRPFDPEERVPFGTKPHHFSYPNPSGLVRLRPPERHYPALPPAPPRLPPRRR